MESHPIIDEFALRNLAGKRVTVITSNYGAKRISTGLVEEIQWEEQSHRIQINHISTPFLGSGCAVITVADEVGKILFHNPHAEGLDIRHWYIAPKERFYEELAYLFGREHADHCRREDVKAKIEDKKHQEEWDAQAKTKKPDLISRGLQFVKAELQDEWRSYADKNTNDGYSCGVIEADCLVFQALSEAKTCEEADKAMDGLGISGFMSGCVAHDVYLFHERGEEYKVYWNRLWHGTGDEKGVINPAILTIQVPEKEISVS